LFAKKLYIAVLFFFFLIPNGSGQQLQYNFTHYTIEDGLAHNHCYSVMKDTFGFVWIATENGISRFDGHEFRNYRFNEQDSFSIGGNWVRSLLFDDQNRLWAGNMRGGLNLYHNDRDQFENFNPLSQDSFGLATKELTNIFCDSEGNIWFGTFREGFGQYHKEENRFSSFTIKKSFDSPRKAWRQNSVFSIIEDIVNPDILWVSNKCDLYRFDKSSEELKYVSTFQPGAARNSTIHKLYMDQAGVIWLGFWGSGLVKYNIDADRWTHFPFNLGKFKEGDGYSNVCLDIEKKSDEEFWLACGLDGIGVFNKKTNTFGFAELPNAYDPNIKSGFAYDVYIDEGKGIWICDQINGLYFIDPARHLFREISTKIQKKGSRKGLNRALDFSFDPKNSKYFVATGQGDGLYVYDLDFNLLSTAPSSLPTRYSYQQFVNVHVDKKSRVWVIDWLQKKLLKYDAENNLCYPVALENYGEYPDHGFALSKIREDQHANLWISSYYGGLFKFNPDEKVLKRYYGSDPKTELPEKAQIESFHIAKDGRIWIGTLNFGIYIFDPVKESFESYPYYGPSNNGLIEDRVHAISQDKNGMIWVGFYTKGIQVIDPAKGPDQKQVVLNHLQELNNEQILSIVSDKNGDMWVQTQGGVFKYNYQTNSFKSFTEKEGLTGYLKPAGFEIIQTGELCVGASEGFYMLDPNSVYFNQKIPDIRLTDFRVGEQKYQLTKRIDLVEEIELAYNDNFFSISFAAMNFQLPQKNQFAYRLKGVGQDWVYSGNRNIANYTNVREGTYLFEVKAANNDGVWNEKPATLRIRIKPPWFRSVIAYLVYLLTFFSLCFAVILYQRKRWQLKTQLKLKAEEARRLKEMDHAKSRIYANITHEFRTPLTVIQGMAEQIRQNPDNKLDERIGIVRRNSKSLLQLINQMLELSKLEGGFLRLNLVNDDITKYLGYLTESFHSFANDKGIHLNFYAENSPVVMDYDPEKIDRILSNLISNAIKFTRQFGKVLVVSRTSGKNSEPFLEIEVRDNGKGISKIDLRKIFDRFYQAQDDSTRIEGGTGIGLALVNELVRLIEGEISVESEPGKGSSFIVKIPIRNNVLEKHSHFSGEDSTIDDPPSLIHADPSKIDSYLEKDKPVLLIVEDNDDVVYYLQSILREDYLVYRSGNGLEGIQKAYELIPDIIISDLMMPGVDGFEVCSTLKNNELTSHIPIIILTAKASDEDRISGLKRGADAYLMKPFSQKELLVRVENLIEIRKQMRKHYSDLQQAENIEGGEINPEVKFLEKLDQLIGEKLNDEHFDTSRLCREIGMSRSQLHRKIKAILDTTPALYIRTSRLRSAKSLLEDSELSISEIAFKTGFKSPSYFSYSYTETYGESPSEFRKKLTKE